jgi:hypothetical protein
VENWSEYTRFFTALLVILDPFMATPILLALAVGYTSAERNRVVQTAALTVAAVLVVMALLGETMLHWLGTILGSFRVGGGIVLCCRRRSTGSAPLRPKSGVLLAAPAWLLCRSPSLCLPGRAP